MVAKLSKAYHGIKVIHSEHRGEDAEHVRGHICNLFLACGHVVPTPRGGGVHEAAAVAHTPRAALSSCSMLPDVCIARSGFWLEHPRLSRAWRGRLEV
jgi:hypothetical protein